MQSIKTPEGSFDAKFQRIGRKTYTSRARLSNVKISMDNIEEDSVGTHASTNLQITTGTIDNEDE